MEHLTIIVSLALLAIILVISASLIVRRVALGRSEGRRVAYVERYRDEVLEFVATPASEPSAALLGATGREERAAVAHLLNSYSRLVRGEARRRILDYLESNRFIEVAIENLGSSFVRRRGDAARMLGEYGSSKAVHHLSMVMVRDRSEIVRLTAARALGRINDYKSAAALLTVLPTDRVPTGVIAQALLNLGPHSLRALVDACLDEAVEIRRVACRAVGYLGEGISGTARSTALEALSDRLVADEDHEVRIAACHSIGLIGDTTSIAALASAIEDPHPAVRAEACEAAAKLGVVELVPRLRDLVQVDPESGTLSEARVARAAARALVALTIDDPTTAEPSPFLTEARELARIRGAV